MAVKSKTGGGAAKTAASSTAKSAAKKPAAKKTAAKTNAKTAAKSKPAVRRPRINLSLFNDLDIEDDYGLKLYFQPIYEPQRERIFGYECLLRILDRDLGMLTPDMFLSVAQKNPSLMRGLEDWTVAEIFRTQEKFRQKRKFVDLLSINIDTGNIERTDFYERTKSHFGKIVEGIAFELKQDVFFDERSIVKETLNKLRRDGILIAVDDFTADFLTFDWGDEVPFDYIKIERTYINRLLDSRKAHMIVQKIVEFAKRYEVDVVAVGVENAAQEAELLSLGITKMQGYYYARPLDTKRIYETPPDMLIHADGAESPKESENNKESEQALNAEGEPAEKAKAATVQAKGNTKSKKNQTETQEPKEEYQSEAQESAGKTDEEAREEVLNEEPSAAEPADGAEGLQKQGGAFLEDESQGDGKPQV